jgi:rhamnogalacturonan endolyase
MPTPIPPPAGGALAALVLAGATLAASAQSIPPNFGSYNLHPLFNPDAVLGWSETRIEERLGRGVVAVAARPGEVYVGWRLLKDDPADLAFNVYRSTEGGPPVRLNAEPLRQTTDYLDRGAAPDRAHAWWVRAVADGREGPDSATAALPADAPVRQYVAIPLRDDLRPGVNKVGIGDLNGDGEYDFIVKRPQAVVDPGAHRVSPDTFKFEAYLRDGTFLWRNDLGKGVELGIWYSPFFVYDLDGDGRAEVALRTAEGTPEASGRVMTGPEWLSVWDGLTGREIDRVDWPARGRPEDWGDVTGNRMSRHMMGVAYLDGKTPSVVAVRGTYGLMKVETWFLRNGKLEQAWKWTNELAGWRYQGQGQHAIHVADLDGDGKDDILNGSIAIGNRGRTMWSTGMGHGDRFYVTDVDPDRPGLEVVYCHEDPHPRDAVGIWDARTGRLIHGIDEEVADNQVGRALVADIDPAYPGMEVWADKFFFTAKGEPIPGPVPPIDDVIWWDDDLTRELFARRAISKWKGPVLTEGIEGAVMFIGDIVGDWREEIVTVVGQEIRVYTTTIPARDRRVTLMQDPLYRIDVGLRVQGYPHSPMTSYFLGTR